MKFEVGKTYEIVDRDNFGFFYECWEYGIIKRDGDRFLFTCDDVNYVDCAMVNGRICSTLEELEGGIVKPVEEPEEITPKTEVTITTTYGELACLYYVMGFVSGNSNNGCLWIKAKDLLDPNKELYDSNHPCSPIINYDDVREDWESLFFKPKKSERDLLIEEKQKQLEKISRELEELKDKA